MNVGNLTNCHFALVMNNTKSLFFVIHWARSNCPSILHIPCAPRISSMCAYGICIGTLWDDGEPLVTWCDAGGHARLGRSWVVLRPSTSGSEAWGVRRSAIAHI